MATLLSVASLAARPIPSAAVTATVSNDASEKGSIIRGTSIPSGAHIFNDKEDVLTAISTANFNVVLCELTLVVLT